MKLNNKYKNIMIVPVLAASLLISGCASTLNTSTELPTAEENTVNSEEIDNNDDLTQDTVNTDDNKGFSADYVNSAQTFLNDFTESFDVNHDKNISIGHSQSPYLDSILEQNGYMPFFQTYHSMEYSHINDLVSKLSDDVKIELVSTIDPYNSDIKQFFNYDELSNNDKILIYMANMNNHFFYEYTLEQYSDDDEVSKEVDYSSLFDTASFVFIDDFTIDVILVESKKYDDYETKEDFLINYYSGLDLNYVDDTNNWVVDPDSFVELSLIGNKPRV